MIDYDRSIHFNPDAAAWAGFFVKTWREIHPEQPPPDEGWMLGWFANAMMAMHDGGPQAAEVASLRAALAAALAERDQAREVATALLNAITILAERAAEVGWIDKDQHVEAEVERARRALASALGRGP